MVFRATKAISQQTLFSLYWTTSTLYGGASVGQEAGCQYLEEYSGSLSPGNEQGMHSCHRDSVSYLL